MPVILRQAHNVPAVPVSSQLQDEQGRVTQEWVHFFREVADLERRAADIEVLARRAWLPFSKDAVLDASYGVVTFGLDTDAVGTNSVGKYGNVIQGGIPFIANLSCVTIPTTADAVFDVLVSHDKGATFSTIFNPGNPFRFTMGASVHVIEFDNVFLNTPLMIDDLIRVDTIQSGGAAGITGVIKWQ